MKNQKGFSLIELLIVVVIIGIIAAIAIPNLLAARRSANEGSAVSSLRTIHGAQATFQATSGNGDFSVTGTGAGQGLVALTEKGLIDSVLGAGSKSGFLFTYQGDPRPTSGAYPATFAAMATPQTTTGITATGTRCFGISTDGVMAAEIVPTTGTCVMALSGGGAAATPVTFGSGATITVMGQ